MLQEQIVELETVRDMVQAGISPEDIVLVINDVLYELEEADKKLASGIKELGGRVMNRGKIKVVKHEKA